MLSEAMTALAAAGGSAVVQAAGTDAWTGFRKRMAQWFGRGNAHRENAVLERLDQTAGELEKAAAVGPSEVERLRIRQEAAWQARIEAVLEGLDDTEQASASEMLGALLARRIPQSSVSAGDGGLAVGNVDARAEGGSIAVGVIHGGAHIARPPAPDPPRG